MAQREAALAQWRYLFGLLTAFSRSLASLTPISFDGAASVLLERPWGTQGHPSTPLQSADPLCLRPRLRRDAVWVRLLCRRGTEVRAYRF